MLGHLFVCHQQCGMVGRSVDRLDLFAPVVGSQFLLISVGLPSSHIVYLLVEEEHWINSIPDIYYNIFN